ncbi:hypothetical protein [Metabacillus hrfriensis]|uniref:Uncharacterized protein n=1 Tax=Metabacillus hrfriensis TaxID=3048891 RepID=A0ACD4RBX6_9BACI|nr:hypothetical protein [Metabacillus sp. CT-WN-B3]WHZ57662.1 hypothetical protein QLQ22_23965 [Metabacillus sp. CT-WN-B3]
MGRKCTISFIFFMLISFSAQAKTIPAIPAIPKESPDKTETIMIVVEKEHAEAVSRKITQSYPNVHIRRTYKKVFSGFTVEGKHKDLTAIQKEPHVLHASPVTAYHADIEESVPFYRR